MSVKTFLDTLKGVDQSNIDALINDCKSVFNCRSIESSTDDYSEGSTYFIKGNEKSRFDLEHIALLIFNNHIKDLDDVDLSKSGAEWWTQVIDSRDDIGFHWDRDYGIEEETGQHIYPKYGTVTYLSDCGGPTVVMNKNGGPDNTEDITGAIDSFVASKPLFGKQLLFEGDLLHAAPSDLVNDDDSDNEDDENDGTAEDDNAKLRITLLVNVWVNHVPIQSIQFPASQSTSLSTNLTNSKLNSLNFTNDQNGPEISINLDAVNCSRTMDWKFNNSDVSYVVSAPLPEASSILSSFEHFHCIEFKYSQMDVMVTLNFNEDESSEAGDSDDEGDNDDDDDDIEEESNKESDEESESSEELPAKKSRRI